MWGNRLSRVRKGAQAPSLASTETTQSTYGIDCFPDTNQADDDKSVSQDQLEDVANQLPMLYLA